MRIEACQKKTIGATRPAECPKAAQIEELGSTRPISSLLQTRGKKDDLDIGKSLSFLILRRK